MSAHDALVDARAALERLRAQHERAERDAAKLADQVWQAQQLVDDLHAAEVAAESAEWNLEVAGLRCGQWVRVETTLGGGQSLTGRVNFNHPLDRFVYLDQVQGIDRDTYVLSKKFLVYERVEVLDAEPVR